MAYSSSRQTLVNILKDGLNESENIHQDTTSLVDEFFSEEIVEKRKHQESGEKVRLATFDVGTYKPEEVSWKIEDGKVFIRGSRSRTTVTGAVGTKFSRCISIPEDIIADTVAARFCVGDGVLVVEGCRKTATSSRTTRRSAFFADTHFSLSVDMGDESLTPLNLSFGSQGERNGKTIELFN